jgi:hypothetical protein
MPPYAVVLINGSMAVCNCVEGTIHSAVHTPLAPVGIIHNDYVMFYRTGVLGRKAVENHLASRYLGDLRGSKKRRSVLQYTPPPYSLR